MISNEVVINETFGEVGTQAIDSKNRIAIGVTVRNFFSGVKRMQIFSNSETGDILLRPILDIPASEAWLFKDKKSLSSIKKGLIQSRNGKVTKMDMSLLAKED